MVSDSKLVDQAEKLVGQPERYQVQVAKCLLLWVLSSVVVGVMISLMPKIIAASDETDLFFWYMVSCTLSTSLILFIFAMFNLTSLRALRGTLNELKKQKGTKPS